MHFHLDRKALESRRHKLSVIMQPGATAGMAEGKLLCAGPERTQSGSAMQAWEESGTPGRQHRHSVREL